MKFPKHVAIIMDGNGRWAQSRGHSRVYGHIRGAKVAKQIIESAADIGIKNLTLFTFSTENWRRPEAEVNFLMNLLFRRLRRELKTLMDNDIRFRFIGDLDPLPSEVRRQVLFTTKETRRNEGMSLVFALNYGGRQEIATAARSLAELAAKGDLEADKIDEQLISKLLQSSFMPDPDLIIRTSGEQRLSNFFLWQAAYSELYVSKKLWPDFTADDLTMALDFFSTKERRYGRTKEQAEAIYDNSKTLLDEASS